MSYSVPDMLQSFGGCFVSFSGRNFESVVESFGVSAGFFGVVVRIWFWLCRLWGWAKKRTQDVLPEQLPCWLSPRWTFVVAIMFFFVYFGYGL